MDDFFTSALIAFAVVLNLILVYLIIKSLVYLIRLRKIEYIPPIVIGMIGLGISFHLVFIPRWFS